MKTKTWVVLFPIISLSLLILVIGFNYVVDPYGFNNKFRIHHINANKTQTDSQSRKFKLGLIEDRKIEGIFLGSSEMTFLGNTDYMQKMTGIKYFNFAFNEQEIYESYKYLEYILKNNKVKRSKTTKLNIGLINSICTDVEMNIFSNAKLRSTRYLSTIEGVTPSH